LTPAPVITPGEDVYFGFSIWQHYILCFTQYVHFIHRRVYGQVLGVRFSFLCGCAALQCV